MVVNKDEKNVSCCKDADLNNYWKKKTIISFILSVFVVFIHMSSFSQYSYEGTNAYTILNFSKLFFKRSFVLVAVPLFFIISGATLFRNYNPSQYKNKLISKTKTLLIPFICWNIINMIFSIITSYSFVSNYFISRQPFELTLSNILLSIFFYKCNGPFWFIFNLMIFVIATPVINYIMRKKTVGAISIIALILLEAFNLRLPKVIFFEPESIIYYLVGCFIGRHYFNVFIKKSSAKMQILASILFIIITLYKLCVEYEVIVFFKAVDIVITIIYALAFWVMTDAIINKITVRPYMKNSFFIYAAHINVSAIIIKLFYLALPKAPIMAIFNFIICSTLSVFFICIMCKYLSRFTPQIYKVLSGNR